MTLPEAFTEKMTHLLGDEAPAFLATYQESRSYGLRANLLKITRDELMHKSDFALKPVPFCPSGFYYSEADRPGKHPWHQAGLYYIQEPSAMFVAEAVGAEPGDRVLDLCAAPGGKSTQLAAAMHNRGLLVTNEIYQKRAKVLSGNIERMGITNALVTNETPDRLAAYFPGNFDKILVDAPCSGEGMFRKDPEAAEYWSPEHVRECAALQARILEEACSMLRQGGVLVYSTCTFSPEENEQQIEALLTRYPDLELVPLKKSDGVEDGRPEWSRSKNPALLRTARLWPHRLRGEGHFVAKLIKNGPAPTKKLKAAPSAGTSLLKDYRTFEAQALTKRRHGRFFYRGSQLYLLPEDCPDFGKLRVIRAGLHLGEQKKHRFEPNHALALAGSATSFQSLLPLLSSGKEWVRYLHGETLPVPPEIKGWTVVTIDGCPLGWGKALGGILKNFYPKGLRLYGLNH
ncbi:RsmF rRNA methyltransferase first C-terminal domain-containing protein [Sporolactobacillus sp. THM19-2]|uniref:RsmF rRNA methyltransferase first C-terminal domain-containing protein n=1 Tax=Sporolactobacillus sp. THM19-2 TaxID=2511171 RepID=UPI001020E551|nr:RsmB/NOP family class I SAM-dependent RNA methyltransferase [Sporolactobacillus sp. THM19-2]RYL88896.1 NOL1/NOP2/sun family putative RNA methylase [Sporolactobacillus sp. THM19-2]